MEEPIFTFDVSPVTAALVDVLAKVPFGSQIAYETLLSQTGAADLKNLPSARRIAARDHSAVFTAVRGVGLMRVKAEDAALIGQNGRHKIRRAAIKSVKEMTSLVRGNNHIGDDVRRRISSEIAHNGLLAHLSTDKVADTIHDKPIIADKGRADARLFAALTKEN